MAASQASRVRLHGLKVRRTRDFEPYPCVRPPLQERLGYLLAA
jgi:hypothetical protein